MNKPLLMPEFKRYSPSTGLEFASRFIRRTYSAQKLAGAIVVRVRRLPRQEGALEVQATCPAWVDAMYRVSHDDVEDAHIIDMFDAIEHAVYDDRDALNATLHNIEIDRLAPEFVVGIPRALFPMRDHLSNWSLFVSRAEQSLASRNGVDARELLQGLL